MRPSWLTIRNAAADSAEPVEILIYGEIGTDWFGQAGVDAEAFVEELRQIPANREIVVGIHSPGGNVYAGLAIFGQLRSRQSRVTIRIDGLAASIASIIAMAGKRIVMPPSSRIMIHDPYAMAVGGAQDMRKAADELDRMSNLLGGIYSERTGLPLADVLEMMAAETWLNADEAHAAGFCDDVDERLPMAASASGFNLKRFAHTPHELTATNHHHNDHDPMKRSAILFDSQPAGGGGRAPQAPGAAANRVEQINQIMFLAAKYGVSSKEAMQFAADGGTEQQFSNHIMETKFKNGQPIHLDPRVGDPEAQGGVGMNASEIKRYSLTRVLRLCAERRPIDGLELECSRAVEKQHGRAPEGFYVPQDVLGTSLRAANNLTSDQTMALALGMASMRGALSAGSSSAGGYLIGGDVLGTSIVELLRQRMITTPLGARTLSGLVGTADIPRHTGAATAAWKAEAAALDLSTQTFGQLSLTPKRIGAATAMSKQLLAQASLDVEALVRMDLVTVLAIEKDRAALTGLGTGGEPTGVLNTSGIGSVTFSDNFWRRKWLEFQADLAVLNADVGALAYVISPYSASHMLALREDNYDTAGFVLDGNIMEGKIAGVRCLTSNQVPSNRAIFGNWSDLIIGEWAGLDIVTDPYSRALTHELQIVVNQLCDVGVRNVASFSASTDAVEVSQFLL